ncbi:LuxR C-terminal-related transcriptional regulator, partial [Microbacterium sp.]|uniref:LuxR C-terminal-related transcriptional regulator n=1 Tax=Microbacterium sp. TaxID=51671 RepID=UPI002E38209A
LATIAPAAPGLLPLLKLGGGGLGRPMLESLALLLADHPGVVLIFDDLHNVTNRAIIDDLWWLADHLPPNAHMVFASRTDLRLALSKHRLRYSLLELRQAELAFDSGVATEVVHRITGTIPSDATVTSLLDSTEGWAAGVQLGAITLRSQDDPEMFAGRLGGTDRLISEYLSEEVLSAQSEERRNLLLRLSVLDRMTPSLVESVMPIRDAEALFDELERDSMFLVRIDGNHEWFRFHHLFRDLLRYRLRARHPDEEARILSAAAEWYEAHGDLHAAIESLLQGRAWNRAIDLLLSRGRDAYERGEMTTMARWLGAIPEAARTARPSAEALYGIALGMSGRAALGEDVLRDLAARTDLEPGLVVIVQAYLSALVQFRPQVSAALAASREALRLLGERPPPPLPDLMGLTHAALLQTLSLGSRGRAHLLAGDLPEAREWLTRSLESPGAQYSAYRIHLLGSLALVEAWAGRLQIAKTLAEEALGLARDVNLLIHPAPADAYLALALVAVHRGLPQSAAFARHEGGVRAASNQRIQLMWIACLTGVLSDDPPEPGSEPASAAPPIVQDALDAAHHRARRLAGEPGTPARGPRAWSARLVEAVADALTARRTAEARALLDAAAFTPRDDVPLCTVEHLVLTGWLAHVEGRSGDCARRLSAALELAAEHGIVSAFLWAGPDLVRLVDGLPTAATAFRREVLQRARESLRPSSPDGELTEPLTDRERELLAYLPSRLTNAELAAQFFVSVNTIKTHTAHIYRKLDAPNRSAAVARATEIGLL